MFKLVTKVNGDETDWAFGADQCWGIHTLWSAISYRSKSAAYNFLSWLFVPQMVCIRRFLPFGLHVGLLLNHDEYRKFRKSLLGHDPSPLNEKGD